MNFKKIFLLSLLICSITAALKALDNENANHNHENKWQPFQEFSPEAQRKLGILYRRKIIADASVMIPLFATIIANKNDKEEQISAQQGLEYTCHKHPKDVTAALHRFINTKRYTLIAPLIEAGANLDESQEGKKYTPRKTLEALANQKKRNGIEPVCTKGLYGWLFGENEECKIIEKTLDTYSKKQQENK